MDGVFKSTTLPNSTILTPLILPNSLPQYTQINKG